MTTRRLLGVLLILGGLSGCSKNYRVGDYVLVLWREEGPYPAYILEQKRQRFRVHFDGYPDRCDEDVTVDQIVGIAKDPVVPANPPPGVSCVRPKPEAEQSAAQVYRVGDRVRVTWRGSTYPAVIVEVIARDSFRVSYEGHEQQWNETVSLERIAGKM